MHERKQFLGVHGAMADTWNRPAILVDRMVAHANGGKHHAFYVDNLYSDTRFFMWALAEPRETYFTGTVRHNRGVPEQIVQEYKKGKTKKYEADPGAAPARLAHEASGKLSAMSLIDNACVYFYSTELHDLTDVTFKRKVWDRDLKAYKQLEYHRLEVNDRYNKHMGGIDITDQLRWYYDPKIRTSREKKWWYVIWMANLNQKVVNSYLIYQRLVRYDRDAHTKELLEAEEAAARDAAHAAADGVRERDRGVVVQRAVVPDASCVVVAGRSERR